MYKLIRPALFLQDAEAAHDRMKTLARAATHTGASEVFRALYSSPEPELSQTLDGVRFFNPVGLAAGFDKDAQFIDEAEWLGFGFTEIGSISAKPREGNSKPRLFRIPQTQDLVNRMGLNNPGAKAIAHDLDLRMFGGIPIGVNIVKTHDPAIVGDAGIDDFCESFKLLYGAGAYLAVNVSCPNTEEGKTFEDPQALDDLCCALFERRKTMHKKGRARCPIYFKFSPDLAMDELDRILDITERHGADGYIFGNTSAQEPHVTRQVPHENKKGGVSGWSIFEKSTDLLGHAYHHLPKDRTLIGTGGIMSPYDALEKIEAGAHLVQVWTGLIYEGPAFVRRINKAILEVLRSEQCTLSELRGSQYA